MGHGSAAGSTGATADAGDGRPVTAPALMSLAVTKIARPVATYGDVPRPRLLELLDRAAGKQLTIVRAGAGWGKTVLVSAWAHRRSTPVAWLSLDTYDNDPQRFWTYVVAALRATGALNEDSPLAGMRSVPRDERERRQRILAGFTRLPDQTVLVIDDFHLVDDRQVLGEMDALLRHSSPLRFILVSRTAPALALSRLQAAGQVGEVLAEDLAFTMDEATALLSSHGLALNPDEMSMMLHRTAGWVAGLRLGAAFLTGDGGTRSVADFAGDIRGIDEYFTDEVLAGRPPRQRRFLLESSVCDQMCADLVNAITGAGDGQRMLEDLEHANDFVTRLGPKPVWFRYHHLLHDVLRHRLRLEMPGRVAELHRRAARWYAGRGSVIEALTQAVRGEDWPYAGRLLVGQAGPLLLTAHRGPLIRILRQIPRDVMTSTPELMAGDVLLLFYSGDYEAIPPRVARIRELLRGLPAASRDPAEVLLMALRVAADRAVGDMPSVVAVESEALTSLAESPFHDATAAAQYRAIGLNSRGLARLWTGDIGRAARDLRAATAATKAVGVELAHVNATGHLALLELMHGSVREAAELAGNARRLAERRGWSYTVQAVAAHFAQALVHLERHEPAAAAEAARHGLRAHESEPEAAQRIVSLLVQARLALAHRQPGQARSLLAQAHQDRNERMRVPELDRWVLLLDAEADLAAGSPDRVERRYAALSTGTPSGLAHRVCLARAALDRGEPRRAEELLAVGASTADGSVATVTAGIVAALVADARGRTTRAVDLFAAAVRLAAHEGIRRPFVTLSGSRLTALADRMRLLTPDDPDLTTTMIDDLRTTGQPAAPAPTGGPLSEREAEVVRYLPTMLTAAQIATELGVSVNTVKAHMRSIYRKLDVERRSDAVAQARRLGIL
ncbi:LuxR C-terminal-related transcriptional regulator [Actinoplanes sp. NPDC049802]|uniref:LuxR C-terminal-related transcriptional regulator n=1 Tax=Actinoplanes sp. NPDC049802 TaxID=3154742 RepID=UPI0033EF402D